MRKIQHRVAAIICLVALLLTIAEAPAESAKRQENAAVRSWFKQYDEIRRSAEATKAEKYKGFFFGKNEPNKENTELATRMMEKYIAAADAMKRLQTVPETEQLQQGYTKYFGSGRQLMADYLEAQKVTPFSNKSLVQSKKKLAALDKTNKRIDAKLRKRFGIPKHQHI